MAGSERRAMTLTYQEEEFVIIATNEDGKLFFIPKDPDNSDYQTYLKSLES
jgi:hypothetical protein